MRRQRELGESLWGHSGCDIMRRCSGSGVCLADSDPGGIPLPRHPDASRKFRSHLVVNPERVPCSGFSLRQVRLKTEPKDKNDGLACGNIPR
jgi:hypothetical protein